MSDPGTSYRTREEIQKIRQERDPIKSLSQLIVDMKWSTEEDIKQTEKTVRQTVDAEVQQAQQDPVPSVKEDFWTDVYWGNNTNWLKRGVSEYVE